MCKFRIFVLWISNALEDSVAIARWVNDVTGLPGWKSGARKHLAVSSCYKLMVGTRNELRSCVLELLE